MEFRPGDIVEVIPHSQVFRSDYDKYLFRVTHLDSNGWIHIISMDEMDGWVFFTEQLKLSTTHQRNEKLNELGI